MAEGLANPIIFTDLDGTLLDHDTYSWEPAAGVLAALRRRRVPIILNSSKTLAELAALRAELELPDPVIAENGALIDVPAGYFAAEPEQVSSLPAREEIQQVYQSVRTRGQYACEAFYELGAVGIEAATGLNPRDAALANQRQATEPVLWRDTAERLAEFVADIESHGLQCLHGGRFVHVMGKTDKVRAMQILLAAYRQEYPQKKFTTIALGDGPNDVAMLAAADVAIVIPGRHDAVLDIGAHPCVVQAAHPGPVGWQNALSQLLEISERG